MTGAAPDDSTTSILGRPANGGSFDARPGLVLLYAADFEALAPIYPLLGTSELGRDPTREVSLPVRSVSRAHARFERVHGGAAEEGFRVVDLDSRNGTFVGRRRVTGPTPIVHGDVITVGDVVLMFVERSLERYGADHIDGRPLVHSDPPPPGAPIGRWQIAGVARDLSRVAKSDMTVAIFGETGTGKELFAAYLHEVSGRRGPLRAINCSALPPALLESELFGFRKGAFSGADRDKPGLFQAANGGTLLLDEIGDMPLEAQAKLLRALQSREVLPLGALVPERIDVRIVSATHRDLRARVDSGQFRGDLFARLSELTVTVPPLRDRREDIHWLCRHFLEKHGHAELRVSPRFMQVLATHSYPFNVRELESAMKRAAAFCDSGCLEPSHLPDDIRSADGEERAATSGSHHPSGGRPTEAELARLLSLHGGNVAAVGRSLDRAPIQVRRWMKAFGLSVASFRAKR